MFSNLNPWAAVCSWLSLGTLVVMLLAATYGQLERRNLRQLRGLSRRCWVLLCLTRREVKHCQRSGNCGSSALPVPGGACCRVGRGKRRWRHGIQRRSRSTGLQSGLFRELPKALDQVEIRRVRWQKQQLNPELLGQTLHHPAMLIAGIVQHQRHGKPQRLGGDLPQQFARGFRVDHGRVRDRHQRVGHGIPGPQHVVALAPRRSFDKQPHLRPEVTQERPQNKVGRVDEEHVPLAGSCFG